MMRIGGTLMITGLKNIVFYQILLLPMIGLNINLIV